MPVLRGKSCIQNLLSSMKAENSAGYRIYGYRYPVGKILIQVSGRIQSGKTNFSPPLQTPEMRKRTINIFFSWMVVAMVYYGLSFNTKAGAAHHKCSI